MHHIELGPIVRACVDEIAPIARAKRIELTSSIPSDTHVIGDARRLEKVVRNLLSNAVKFTPAGGRVAVDLANDGDVLQINVRDNGKGLLARELPFVFDPFHAGDASMTRAEGGLGLGLAIVRHVVEAHGGTVRAESAGAGQGTTLVVSLPAAAEKHARARRSEAHASAGS
jgi:signal transduction histidine kinase